MSPSRYVARPKPLGLLLIQPTPFCNIDCSYCYLRNRSDTARMSQEVVAAIADNIIAGPLVPDELSLCWHGGEPLSVPPAWVLHSTQEKKGFITFLGFLFS